MLGPLGSSPPAAGPRRTPQDQPQGSDNEQNAAWPLPRGTHRPVGQMATGPGIEPNYWKSTGRYKSQSRALNPVGWAQPPNKGYRVEKSTSEWTHTVQA